MIYDAWTGALSWWSCQSTVTNSFSLLNHPNNFCGRMFKLNTKFDADLLLFYLILNVIATQYTCSLSSVYCPHWLVQWNHHCSCMCIPVHPPWLPCYIDVVQTVLAILMMLRLFLDRPHKSEFNYWESDIGPGWVPQFIRIVLINQGCGFDPWSGHLKESINECINKWNINLSLFPPLFLYLSLKWIHFLKRKKN